MIVAIMAVSEAEAEVDMAFAELGNFVGLSSDGESNIPWIHAWLGFHGVRMSCYPFSSVTMVFLFGRPVWLPPELQHSVTLCQPS